MWPVRRTRAVWKAMKLNRSREDWILLLLAGGCLTLAYFFARYGSEVVEGEMTTIDLAVRQWTLAHRSAAGRAFFGAVTFLGTRELLVAAGVLVGWRLFRRTRGWVPLLVFCALTSAEFVRFLKHVYQVRRPEGGIERMSMSFPSGHSSGSAAILIFLGYVAIRNGVKARIVVPVALVIVLLVGISRVYLDMHWTSDVLGGWVIGAAFGVGCCAIFDLIQRERARQRNASASPEPQLQ
jgi:undecaprenyl-diphosphatase